MSYLHFARQFELAAFEAGIATQVRTELATELAAVLNSNTLVQDIPGGVWEKPTSELTTSGSIGHYITKKLISLKEWYSQ